jgi:hypothetical protein
LNTPTTLSSSLEDTFFYNLTDNSDKVSTSKLLNSRFYLPAPLEPIVSTNPNSDLRDYDNPNYSNITTVNNTPRLDPSFNLLNDYPVTKLSETTSSEVINILQGKKEGSMEALSTAY